MNCMHVADKQEFCSLQVLISDKPCGQMLISIREQISWSNRLSNTEQLVKLEGKMQLLKHLNK